MEKESQEMISYQQHMKEILEKWAKNEDILWIAHHREHEKDSISLKLQAIEYERRLESLNHEAERLKAAQLIIDVIKEKLHQLEVEITAIKESNTWLGRTVWGAIVLIVLAILGYIANHFVK